MHAGFLNRVPDGTMSRGRLGTPSRVKCGVGRSSSWCDGGHWLRLQLRKKKRLTYQAFPVTRRPYGSQWYLLHLIQHDHTLEREDQASSRFRGVEAGVESLELREGISYV